MEILTGEQEASAAGFGVLSAIPDADGVVGDLGGGSLELVRVAGVAKCLIAYRFPLGVLRIAKIRDGKGSLDRYVAKALQKAGWACKGKGLPLYLVGGSWRSLARLDMHLTGYPLPVIHQYEMSADTVARLGRTISHVGQGQAARGAEPVEWARADARRCGGGAWRAAAASR